ncbi:MAG: glyoxalase/bleomycin resistance protein/dioxygenase [Parcubacteria group bacterium Gr01-1014_13]|nr:MAG: glyoxalase/bleomycin resistance protein/dioxygenase [Parcubacteria group bacterium Gr01-1014_13]
MYKNPVVHFEMPAEDKARMNKFYESAFGWETRQLGPEMGEYVIVTTTETDENRMVKTPGTINGGFYQKKKPDQYTRITIAVDDIQEAMKKVIEAGGTVVGGMQNPGQPDNIPGVGLYATFIDTEGNLASMLQPFNK